MIAYTHVSDWNGGRFQYEGLDAVQFEEKHRRSPVPVVGTKAILQSGHFEIQAKVVGFHKVFGSDLDHGHEYHWSYNEPMFQFEGCPFPIPAAAVWKQGFSIFLEV
jgi:hypothetical protein